MGCAGTLFAGAYWKKKSVAIPSPFARPSIGRSRPCRLRLFASEPLGLPPTALPLPRECNFHGRNSESPSDDIAAVEELMQDWSRDCATMKAAALMPMKADVDGCREIGDFVFHTLRPASPGRCATLQRRRRIPRAPRDGDEHRHRRSFGGR